MKRKVDHLIIHCAYTRPSMDIGALEIDRWHREKGWWGNGYHFVIRRDGTLESRDGGQRCRPLEKAGAHVGDCGTGWNKRSIGVCLVGGAKEDLSGYEDNFTEEQYAALKSLVEYFIQYIPGLTVLGHRELIEQTNAPAKDCPSFDVKSWLEREGLASV